VILDQRTNGKLHVLDVGETGEIKTRIDGHERKEDWERQRSGTIVFAVYYTPGWSNQQRRDLESQIRDTYSPPCGDR